MLAEHTTEELELWSQLKEQVLSKIHESNLKSYIQCREDDGQFILTRKKPALRRVVLSFTSPGPVMYVHFEEDNAPPRSSLMLRVEGDRLTNAASDALLTVDDLAMKVLMFLQAGK